MKKATLLIILCVFTNVLFAQKQSTVNDSIKTYFSEIKVATKAAINLWGIDLYGPILLVNPVTRQVYANEPDSAAILKADREIYSGVLPTEINIANTSINWSGKRWAMIIQPLPTDKKNRINLLAHELFHRSQPSLGFQILNSDNNHLDLKDGRIYLRLELEALIKAVNAKNPEEIKSYLSDALTFRKYRQSIYPGADSSENMLELNEGLAEYTGIIVGKLSNEQSVDYFNKSYSDFLSNPTFVRSFAYQTTAMYGWLLYNGEKTWNKKVTATTNLTDLFSRALNISIPADLKQSADNSMGKYNGQLIISEETARETRIKKLVAEYKSKFIEQPHFELRFEQMNVSYDPRNIMPLEDKGTVYPNIRVSDKWGILTVTNGALMSSNWDKITVTVPVTTGDKNISGDGWTLELNAEYGIAKDERTGNYKILKK